jgi:DeoR/GlpR family transcriptional regulator of sugar metabolism
VSEVTIRQYLDLLEKQGLLRRTHGGAMLTSKSNIEKPFKLEETSFCDEKERIAQAAIDMIPDGATIILDVGTTVTALARNLINKKNLTVITNGLNIATILENNPNVTVIVTGGTLRSKQHSLVNPFAQFILEKIYADIAFISVSGIAAEFGITNVNTAEAEIKALFAKSARQRIVLADSSKVGNISMAKICSLDAIDTLITDNQVDPRELAKLQEKGLAIKIV